MSIAVSVIVRPSPGLRLLHAGACCCVMTSAVACPGWLAPSLCVLAGALGWCLGRSPRNASRLDISGVGVLRLTVYQEEGTTRGLLAGSTLWPGLLLLRLGGADGRVLALPVLRDSVSRPDMRALALACRSLRAEIKPRTL